MIAGNDCIRHCAGRNANHFDEEQTITDEYCNNPQQHNYQKTEYEYFLTHQMPRSHQPRSGGFPAGLLDQPSYGWGLRQKQISALQRAYLTPLAFVLIGVKLVEAVNRRVVYHPLHIPRAVANSKPAKAG